jgi:hypothetical protein
MAGAAKGSGGMINMNDFGLENMEQILENLEENEKIMTDMEKPWEEKLEEARGQQQIKDQERASFHGGSESGNRPILALTEESKTEAL